MTDHEFGDWSLTVCDLCFMYVKGHSAGKEQAFLEYRGAAGTGAPFNLRLRPVLHRAHGVQKGVRLMTSRRSH